KNFIHKIQPNDMGYVNLEEKNLDKLLRQPDTSSDDALEQILNLTAYHSDPAKQRKLVELVSRLQKQRVKDPSTREQVTQGGRFRVWTDLPSLSSLVLGY